MITMFEIMTFTGEDMTLKAASKAVELANSFYGVEFAVKTGMDKLTFYSEDKKLIDKDDEVELNKLFNSVCLDNKNLAYNVIAL